jgi:phospholipid transport system substrate-binding protein
MKNILKFLLLVSFIATVLVADEKAYVKESFEKVIEDVLEVVKNKQISKDERNAKVVEVVSPMFDFVLMGKLSLGKKWKSLGKSDRKKFIELYVERMKKSYSSKLDSFNDEKIIIKDIKQTKKNRIELQSILMQTSGDEFKVNYKFYKPKKTKKEKLNWIVYDVEIQGVSILKTDKAQFKEYLHTHTLSQLMDSMK